MFARCKKKKIPRLTRKTILICKFITFFFVVVYFKFPLKREKRIKKKKKLENFYKETFFCFLHSWSFVQSSLLSRFQRGTRLDFGERDGCGWQFSVLLNEFRIGFITLVE